MTDVSWMTLVSEIEPQLYLYTIEVWVVRIKNGKFVLPTSVIVVTLSVLD
ncbi:MAG: hypothetical protein ACK45T_01315 [Pseudanabaena sp.]|nr:hypothetical protein [Pseudanabaena sp. M007S1SP1A06QC]